MRTKGIVQNVKVNRQDQNTTQLLKEGKRADAQEKKSEWDSIAKMTK